MKKKDIQKAKSPASSYIKEYLKKWNEEGKTQILKTFEEAINILDLSYPRIKVPTKPLGSATLKIRATNEAAYQRAFFMSDITTIKNLKGSDADKKIIWFDLEVPVVANSTKQLDLIGKIDNDFVVAEIKCLPSGKLGESPLYAALEGLEYALLAKKAMSDKDLFKLRCHSNAKVSENYWMDYNDCKYIIVGTTTKHWDKASRGKECWRDHIGKLEEVAEWIETKYGYILIFIEYLDEDFRGQKGQKKLYKPKLINNPEAIWKQVSV